MALPNDLNFVSIDGFPRSMLPKISQALDNNEVIWIVKKPGISMFEGEFEWKGCRFSFCEIMETIQSIKLTEWCCDDGIKPSESCDDDC